MLAESAHVVRVTELQPSEAALTEEQTAKLLGAVAGYEAWLTGCAETPPPGYITLSRPGLLPIRCAHYSSFQRLGNERHKP